MLAILLFVVAIYGLMIAGFMAAATTDHVASNPHRSELFALVSVAFLTFGGFLWIMLFLSAIKGRAFIIQGERLIFLHSLIWSAPASGIVSITPADGRNRPDSVLLFSWNNDESKSLDVALLQADASELAGKVWAFLNGEEGKPSKSSARPA